MPQSRWSAVLEWPQATFLGARGDRWRGLLSGMAGASAVFLGVFDRAASPPAPREPLAASRVAGFETNHGEAEAAVRFLSRADGFSLGLATAEARLRPACPANRCPVIRLRFVGTEAASRLVPEDPLPGAAYAAVLYDGLYPGIGIRFVGYGGDLSYTFLVDRGASPQSVVLELDGVDHIESGADGGFLATGAGARLALPAPAARQYVGRERVVVEARYVVRGRRVSLDVGAYDIRCPLEISGGRAKLTDPHAVEARSP